MGLGDLGAGGGELFNGDELLALSSFQNVPGRRLPQAGDGYEGRQELPVLNEKFGGMRAIQIHGGKGEAPQVELVTHLQSGEHILVFVRGRLVAVDGGDVGLNLLQPPGHHGGVKAALLAPAVKVGGVKGQGLVNLEPGNPEGHHHIGYRMGLGKEVLDLLAGTDVPIRHAGGPHLLFRSLWQAPSLPDCLHNLKRPLFRHATGDQVEHNVIPASNGLVDGGCLGGYEVLGIAQPHIRAVGEAGQPQQRIKPGGHGVHEHPPGEPGIELRNGHGPGGAQDGVVLIAQHLGRGENGHGVLVIQGNFLGVHSGHVLHHPDHGGVIVAQHVQLQQVLLHGVVFKVGGNGVCRGVVCRMLDRAEVPDLVLLGDDHQAAGMLAGGSTDPHTAGREPVFLRPGDGPAPLRQVFFHISKGRLLRHGANGPGSKHVGLPKHLHTVGVSLGLVLAGEIQVNVRHLIAAKPQEGLKGNVEAVFLKGTAAFGTHSVRQVGPTAISLGHIKGGKLTVRIGAAVMRREGIDLRNSRHVGHNGGTH